MYGKYTTSPDCAGVIPEADERSSLDEGGRQSKSIFCVAIRWSAENTALPVKPWGIDGSGSTTM
jgi:hypothetical protein